MQVKKDTINHRILETARKEFLSQGYQKTTMRSIARKSRITTSNIYNYFDSKDDLFIAIVKPTLDRITGSLDEIEKVSHEQGHSLLSYPSMKRQFESVIQFINSHREDLNLILFKSYGSRIQNIKEEFINRTTEIFIRQLAFLKKTRPDLNAGISRFFVHNLCSLYANIVVEIIMHDISFDKMKDYSEEFLTFVFHGEKALIGWDDVDQISGPFF